jgi:hypothetical protein
MVTAQHRSRIGAAVLVIRVALLGDDRYKVRNADILAAGFEKGTVIHDVIVMSHWSLVTGYLAYRCSQVTSD